ncbi:MAG: PQQ-binding-like beta-propeller repeat protein [Myxococcales bacterium]|nr:PQQ-binding-like beta-propeller repeat protein [Myxococcales bacterium]MCB9521573.1 PQQ-binding-like beta-propeller repeat protein [Myxococcales bacterium]MCB9530569.1 PQQ-binding-like beta-propeller repeat protein [Myxococcales bacterium]MCB9534482.1 PQQ-binding-like beta-propeller repeat protein [Myxococcales bacterium]
MTIGAASCAATAPSVIAAQWTVALDSPSGSTWQPILAGGDAFAVRRAVDAGALEIVEPTLELRRIDARSGETLWTTDLPPLGTTTDLVRCGDVTLMCQGSTIRALDDASGRVLWGIEYPAPPSLIGCDDTQTYAAFSDGQLDARRLGSGVHRWTSQLDGWEIRAFVGDGRRRFGAVAVRLAGGDSTRVAYFPLDQPRALPAWQRAVSGGTDVTLTATADVVSVRLASGMGGVSIRNGEELSSEAQTRVGFDVGGGRLTDEQLSGAVVALRALSMFPLGADIAEPAWTRTVASSTPLIGAEPTTDGGLLITTATRAVLVDTDTGSERWHAALVATDDDGRACTLLGVAHGALLARCARPGSEVLVSLPTVAPRRR